MSGAHVNRIAQFLCVCVYASPCIAETIEIAKPNIDAYCRANYREKSGRRSYDYCFDQEQGFYDQIRSDWKLLSSDEKRKVNSLIMGYHEGAAYTGGMPAIRQYDQDRASRAVQEERDRANASQPKREIQR